MIAADHRAVRDRVNPPARGWREMGVNGGRPCCAHAYAIYRGERFFDDPCVCFAQEYCPTHHRVTHVGTHD